MLKELGVGNWSIHEIRKHFLFLKEHGNRTFGMYTLNDTINVSSQYANKMVNHKFYGKVTIENKPIKYLTDEEFRAGKSGYILVPFTTINRIPQILKKYKN